MPTIRLPRLLAVAAIALLAAAPAKAGGPNVAVCMTLANAYNACIVDQQRRGGDYGRGYDGGYDPNYGGGSDRRYGGGYGRDYDGNWDDDDYDYWRQQRRAAGANRAQAACMSWLIQMKAANCY